MPCFVYMISVDVTSFLSASTMNISNRYVPSASQGVTILTLLVPQVMGSGQTPVSVNNLPAGSSASVELSLVAVAGDIGKGDRITDRRQWDDCGVSGSARGVLFGVILFSYRLQAPERPS